MSSTASGSDPVFVGLLKECKKLLMRCFNHKYGYIFTNAVDPVKLGIPDYFDIIKHPMDLGTIKQRLESSLKKLGKPYKSPLDFAADMRLVFQNCKTYNDPASDAWKMGDAVEKVYQEGWEKAMIEKKLEQHKQGGGASRAAAHGGFAQHRAPMAQPQLTAEELAQRGKLERKRKKAELKMELARVQSLKERAATKEQVLAECSPLPMSPPAKPREAKFWSNAPHERSQRMHVEMEVPRKRGRDEEPLDAPPSKKPAGEPAAEAPLSDQEKEKLAEVLESLEPETLIPLLEKAGVPLNADGEEVELDLSELSDDVMRKLRSLTEKGAGGAAEPEAKEAEPSRVEPRTASAAAAAQPPPPPRSAGASDAAAPPDGDEAELVGLTRGSDGSSSSSGESSSSSSDDNQGDGGSVDSGGGSVGGGGAGQSTKVSGTTSSGQFFMKPAGKKPKEINLANADAWGAIAAPAPAEPSAVAAASGEGTAGAGSAEGNGAAREGPAAAGPSAPRAGGDTAGGGAGGGDKDGGGSGVGGGEGKAPVLLTEFEHFNREQQRRHEAARKQEEQAAAARREREAKHAEEAERDRQAKEQREREQQEAEQAQQRQREAQREAALAALHAEEDAEGELVDLENDRAMVNEFGMSMGMMGSMGGSTMERLGLTMKSNMDDDAPPSGPGSPPAAGDKKDEPEEGEV